MVREVILPMSDAEFDRRYTIPAMAEMAARLGGYLPRSPVSAEEMERADAYADAWARWYDAPGYFWLGADAESV